MALNIEPFPVDLFWLNYVIFLFYIILPGKDPNNWKDINDLNFDNKQFVDL